MEIWQLIKRKTTDTIRISSRYMLCDEECCVAVFTRLMPINRASHLYTELGAKGMNLQGCKIRIYDMVVPVIPLNGCCCKLFIIDFLRNCLLVHNHHRSFIRKLIWIRICTLDTKLLNDQLPSWGLESDCSYYLSVYNLGLKPSQNWLCHWVQIRM